VEERRLRQRDPRDLSVRFASPYPLREPNRRGDRRLCRTGAYTTPQWPIQLSAGRFGVSGARPPPFIASCFSHDRRPGRRGGWGARTLGRDPQGTRWLIPRTRLPAPRTPAGRGKIPTGSRRPPGGAAVPRTGVYSPRLPDTHTAWAVDPPQEARSARRSADLRNGGPYDTPTAKPAPRRSDWRFGGLLRSTIHCQQFVPDNRPDTPAGRPVDGWIPPTPACRMDQRGSKRINTDPRPHTTLEATSNPSSAGPATPRRGTA
jgi:hypothetical protein